MESILQDLRQAVRGLRRAPGFAVAAVLTLALGIGANAAIFSVVDGVLLRPSPIADVDRVMMVWGTDRVSGTQREPTSIPDFDDYQQRTRQFAALAAFEPIEVSIAQRGGDAVRLAGLQVSAGFLPMLGVQPIAGRLLSDAETRAGGPRGVLISEDLWEQQYARSAGAVGGTIRLDDEDWTVVGVLARTADFGTLQLLRGAAYGRGFADRGDRFRIDVWAGLRPAADASRDNHPAFVIGRLAPGVTPGSAQKELGAVAAELERTYESNSGRGVFIEPMNEVVFRKVRPAMLALLGAVALVLLVACANVANLLLVRGAGRLRDVGVRIALGAGRRRLAQQFLAESAIITVTGAALGVLIAHVGLDALMSLAPASLPRADEIGVDRRVLGVTLAVSLAVCAVFGALPLMQVRDDEPGAALQSGVIRGASTGRGQRRLRSALVVGELAMAVMLMSGAGLLVRSLWRLQQVNPGFDAGAVLKAEFDLPPGRYPQDRRLFPAWPAQQRFYAELESRLRAMPGVAAVAVAGANPLDAGFTSSISVVGREADADGWPEPSVRSVSASYFSTMQVPVADGRPFTPADDAAAPPVIMLNESALRRFFGDRPALGERINLWGAQRLIVGVVGDERMRGLDAAVPPAVYLPLQQMPVGNAVLVRVEGDPVAFAPTLRRVVRELDPALPLFGVEPLQETIATSFAERRFVMRALLAFAVLALALGAIGVHGVLAYTVAQRTREIGIRLALGAAPGEVRSLIVREGAMLTGLGLVVGLVGAYAVTGVLSALVFGVGTRDPLTLAGVAVTLGVVAMLATWLPASRAGRLDPLVALRTE